jgi:hypothetical protein
MEALGDKEILRRVAKQEAAVRVSTSVQNIYI